MHPKVGCSDLSIFPSRHVPIRGHSHHAPCHAQSHCSGTGTRPSRADILKATPFFFRLPCHPFTPFMSFLPLSYSTTSLSTTNSACFTETSDSTGYTSDGRRDSAHCAEGNKGAGGGEDEMERFLLGPGWVRNSVLLYPNQIN